jgi:DNA-binding CsgD family transcriptional regulator
VSAIVATTLEGFLTRVPEHSCALAIEGPPGIGKTHHWTDAVDHAGMDGWRLLIVRPGEAESRTGGIGLLDLLGDVSDEEIATLPAPQQRALSAALLRAATFDGQATSSQLVAVAVSTLVANLAADAPLLIAIDDLQWLDATTTTALTFLARRLPPRNVGMLLTVRTPAAESPLLAELEAEWALRRVDVPPLDENEIVDLVHERLDFPVPASVLARAAAASAGNPFYAVELVQIWAADTGEFLEKLAAPQPLQALVSTRLQLLPESCRLALATVSAIGRASVADLSALGVHEALAPAERANIVALQQGVMRFTHPLLASAAYDALDVDERSQLHLRIADVVTDVEHRARHLALGSLDADEDVASLLDEVCGVAERRADINAAVDAAKLAVRMTPADRSVAARRFTLGRLLHKLGNVQAAQAELEGLTREDTQRRIRVRALTLLTELAFATISHEAAQAYGEAAVAAALPGEDDDLLADAHLYLAQVLHASTDVRAHGNRALELIEAGAHPNPASHAYAIALLAALDFFAGNRFDAAPFDRALAVEDAGGVLAEDSMMGYYVAVLAYADQLVAALELADRWAQRCADEGCESQQPFFLMWRSYLLLRAGRLDEAEAVIRQHIGLAERLGQDYNVRFGRVNLGRLAVLRGDFATGREIGESEALAAAGSGAVQLEMSGRRLAGEAALYDGDAGAAIEHLRRYEELRDTGRCEHYSVSHLALLAEALAVSGRLDDAEVAIARFEVFLTNADSVSGLAGATRARGMLAAARGDEGAALQFLDAAIGSYADDARLPFEHARAVFVKGQLLRRLRRKANAKSVLTEAADAFSAIGASGWVERVHDEAARIGLRPPAPVQLTPTERKIADMVATGTSAKDVAAALYLSPRTIEGHLARIYKKVGVRTRAELVAKYANPLSSTPG